MKHKHEESIFKVKYPNDRKVLEQLEGRYVYLGRSRQHFHRYYDVFVRDDLELPPVPAEAIINHRGAVQLTLIPAHRHRRRSGPLR